MKKITTLSFALSGKRTNRPYWTSLIQFTQDVNRATMSGSYMSGPNLTQPDVGEGHS